MKKYILLLSVFFVILFTEIHAQRLHFGFKIGASANSLVLNGGPSYALHGSKPLFYFQVGIFSQIKISDNLSIVPEAQYIRKGFKSATGAENIDYIDFPFMLSYSLVKRLNIEFGPELGIKLAAKATYSGRGGFTRDISDSYNTIDFGAAGGLRYAVTDKLAIVGRYFYGFTSVTKLSDQVPPKDYIAAHNQNAQLSLAYLIN